MIFRLSQKLNTKINAGALSAMPLDENPYADWSAHLFTAEKLGLRLPQPRWSR